MLAVALTITGTANPWSRQLPLESEAAELTGAGPVIVCETWVEHEQGVRAGKTSYYGFTMMTRPKLVVISPFICRSLRQRKLDSAEFAHAVFVFAHELGHVARRHEGRDGRRVLCAEELASTWGSSWAGEADTRAGVGCRRGRMSVFPFAIRGTCTREGSVALR